MLEGHHGRWKFSRLTRQLNSIGQHHDFGCEHGVREGVIVIHPLPRDREQVGRPLRLPCVGVFKRWREDVADIDFVSWPFGSKLGRNERLGRSWQHGRQCVRGAGDERSIGEWQGRVIFHNTKPGVCEAGAFRSPKPHTRP